MKKPVVLGAVAVVAVFAAVFYVARQGENGSPAPVAVQPAAAGVASTAPKKSVNGLPLDARGGAAPSAPQDPRLATLAVSPDNGLINFVVGDNGKVIREIDDDPGSPSYKKPLREYTYHGDKVVALTQYKYLGGQVQVTRTAVSYKADGSVDQFHESTSYDFPKKPGPG